MINKQSGYTQQGKTVRPSDSGSILNANKVIETTMNMPKESLREFFKRPEEKKRGIK